MEENNNQKSNIPLGNTSLSPQQTILSSPNDSNKNIIQYSYSKNIMWLVCAISSIVLSIIIFYFILITGLGGSKVISGKMVTPIYINLLIFLCYVLFFSGLLIFFITVIAIIRKYLLSKLPNKTKNNSENQVQLNKNSFKNQNNRLLNFGLQMLLFVVGLRIFGYVSDYISTNVELGSFIFFNPVSVIVDLIIVAFEVAGLWFIKNVYMYLSLLILSSSLIYWIIITTAPKDAWMIALVIIPITIGYVVLSILKILINQLLLSKKIKEQLIK